MKWLKNILIALMLCLVIFWLWFLNNGEGEYTKTEFLLDTSCTVTFYGKESEEAAEAVFDEIRRLEGLMSMYMEGSDVSLINNAGAEEEVKVSSDTYKVIETALKISEESGGAFDITIAPLTKLWNFAAENPEIPSGEEIESALKNVGYENIALCGNNTLKKLNSNTLLDLGGIAKGYAGDCAAELAKKYNLTGGIIDLGGNIICFGENPKSKDGKWRVGIQVPFSPQGTYNKIVEIDEGAVVTSGNYQRYFRKSDKIYHHIINPKTGYPAERDYDSVTVVLKNSLEADCLATAVYVMGKDGENLVEKYDGEVYFEKTN